LRKRFVGFCPKMAVMTWILSCEKIHKLSYSLLLVFYFFFINATSFNTDKLVCICLWIHEHF